MVYHISIQMKMLIGNIKNTKLNTTNMTDFIRSIPPKQRVDQDNVDAFINKFNELIEKHRFTANTGLDDIPTLNENEFSLVKSKAHKMGYDLTRFEDNYNSITYKLVHI